MDVKEGTDRQSEQQSDRGDIQQQLVTVLGWRADKHESLLDLVVFTLPVSNYNQLKTQCFSVYGEFYRRLLNLDYVHYIFIVLGLVRAIMPLHVFFF